jgi:AcrR family transcriptional regulator
MANRVNVNITATDSSRAGLRALRRRLRELQRDARRAGGTIRFDIDIPDGASRREIRRITRALRREPVTIRTRLDPPTPPVRTWRRRVLRTFGRGLTLPVRLSSRVAWGTLRSTWRVITRTLGGILSDGIGQGIIAGVQAAGPVAAAVFIGILVAAVAAIGAALSGILVTALGAAFVGVGGVSAAMSDQVKKKWATTLEELKKDFASVGEPMIPVLEHGLEILEDMADRAAPRLRKAIEDTLPATEKFMELLMEGVESFGKEAFDPIMDAWNVFAPVFGEQWNEFMGELGDSFGDMADLVREHPTEIAAALEVVFEALELLVDTVTFLAKTWVGAMGLMGDVAGAFLMVIRAIVTGALETVQGLLDSFAFVEKHMPFNDSTVIQNAAKNFRNWKDGVLDNLEDAEDAAFGFDETLERMNRERTLKANIESWKRKLKIARADLKKTTSQKAKAKVQANIDDLTRKLKNARDQLNALNGKTANTYVNTWYTSQGFATGGDGTRGGRLAHGGVVGAAATGGVRSNLTLVGEQGPELVRLPSGSNVRSNPDTRRILRSGAGGGGGSATLMIDAAGDDMSQLLLKILRRAIRTQGGDVQVVLGRG